MALASDELQIANLICGTINSASTLRCCKSNNEILSSERNKTQPVVAGNK